MTAIELNAELYRAMGEIADDKTLLAKVLKYVKSLAPNKNKRLTADERLDAALAKFHKDWGGEGSATEIAQELRQGADMVRDVETW